MKILAFLFSIFPQILGGVIAVEAAAKGVPGETKKQIVLASIDAAAQAGEAVPEAHVQAASTLIDSIVKNLNASGFFGHAPAPATPPAA